MLPTKLLCDITRGVLLDRAAERQILDHRHRLPHLGTFVVAVNRPAQLLKMFENVVNGVGVARTRLSGVHAERSFRRDKRSGVGRKAVGCVSNEPSVRG
jgi:hypothetical protein